MSAKRPFATNAVLTAIAMGYRNGAMIADQVAPRVTVGSEQFKYTKHRMEHFDPEDDMVGRTGRVNEVEFGADQLDGSVVDHGLETPVPYSDVRAAENGQANFAPLSNAALKLTKKIELNRERRVAGMVFNANSYPTGNKVQLAGNDQWSDFTNSDPVDDIMSAIDGMLIRPNTMVLGWLVYSKLKQSPVVSKAIGGSSVTGKIVTRQQLADLFEVSQILVGDSWNNTANKGQTSSMSRIWGKHCALLHLDGQPTDMDEITFMATAQHGDKTAMEWDDRNVGLNGGKRVRVGETVKEIILASDVGYFIEDAVA